MDVTYYRDELARKALEKLEHLKGEFDAGKIGIAALRAGVNSIWWVSCGLVDKETEAVICTVFDEVEREYHRRMSLLKGEKE